MASVIDYPICERCGRECINEFNCRTFEEFQTCQVCGAGFAYTIKRDEDGKIVKDKAGNVVWQHEKNAGNGVAYIVFDDGVIFVDAAPGKDEYDKWFKHIMKEIDTNKHVVREECYVTKWDYEKEELIVVYGKLPEEYDDCSCFDELNFEDFEETNDDEYIPF